MHLTTCESKDTSRLWGFLAGDTGRMCSESLFLEILDTAGRGDNGNNFVGRQIDDDRQNAKRDCFGNQ